jgi:nuclear mRNA export protein SAC3
VVPSELRTPDACLRTVDYLFNLLNEHTLPATHAFVRDRSRAVRLDLRVQQIEDELAMTITERCARLGSSALNFVI